MTEPAKQNSAPLEPAQPRRAPSRLVLHIIGRAVEARTLAGPVPWLLALEASALDDCRGIALRGLPFEAILGDELGSSHFKPKLLQWVQAVVDGHVVAVTEAGLLNWRWLSLVGRLCIPP